MPRSTRDKLLKTARTLFAARGFYGVSIADISKEQGVTKQALLHHFSTKEKLYGEVLRQISDEFEALQVKSQSSHPAPAAQLKSYLMNIYEATVQDETRSRILMRELLDNKRRIETAGTWYLKPFLEKLVDMMKQIPSNSDLTDIEALASIYQILGVINYYGISGPTLQGIFGAKTVRKLDSGFSDQLAYLIDSIV